MDKPVKVTVKAEAVYEAVCWHPESGMNGSMVAGGILQASHGSGSVGYLDIRGKRTEIDDGDFIVYKNGVVDEVMKPAAFAAKFVGIAVPLTVAEEGQLVALEARKASGTPPMTPEEELVLADLRARKAAPVAVPEPAVPRMPEPPPKGLADAPAKPKP